MAENIAIDAKKRVARLALIPPALTDADFFPLFSLPDLGPGAFARLLCTRARVRPPELCRRKSRQTRKTRHGIGAQGGALPGDFLPVA